MKNRTGIWIVGAWGGVATTVTVGWLATMKKVVPAWGLTTELPEFSGYEMPDWSDFHFGGCEVRASSLAQSAEELVEQKALDAEIFQAVASSLPSLDAEIVPGILSRSGKVVEEMADWANDGGQTAREKVAAMQDAMRAFVKRNQLEHLIVVNLMSTEPASPLNSEQEAWTCWEALDQTLDSPECPLPASSLYAVAALQLGYDYINFTPSLGATPPALEDLAVANHARMMGNDGKTGETLMKSVLAPLFAHRHLQVMSWVGHNIFGNRDGVVLDDPRNKATKVASKSHLLTQILGYAPQTLVSIEYIQSLGDWKTAWDHIHFRGFLGTPMTLQFTWQGCDSLLAAPLVLDMIRLTEWARRRQFIGKMDFLACFFKSPIRVEEQGFVRQFEMLEAWIHAK